MSIAPESVIRCVGIFVTVESSFADKIKEIRKKYEKTLKAVQVCPITWL